MSKTITRKYIQRITKREGNTNIRQSSGGGGGGGGVSQYWVDDNYVSKEFFNRLFEIHDENGDPILPNDVETEIDNIQAMFGFWTNAYLSALGQNEGGGGAELTLASLADVAVQGVTDGQALVWNAVQGKWIPGTGGIDLTAMWNALAGNTNQQINATHLTTALADYLPLAGGTMTSTSLVTNMNADLLDGHHAADFALASAISDMATKTWVGQNYLGLHATADAATKLATACTLWGQSFDGTGNVSGDMSSVGNISFSASGKNIGGLMYFDTTNSNIGIGTSAPSYKLDVVGMARTKLLFFYNRANNANAGYIGAGSSYVDYIYFQAYTNNGLYIGANNGFDFVILPNHNVGVGTTEPSYKMHVNGTFYASGNSSIGGTFGVTGATTLSSTLGVTGATTLSSTLGVSGATTLSSSLSVTGNSTLTGYVGIGTAASSSYALKVSGVAYASTGVYSGGYVTALSDARHKDIQGEVGLTVNEVANAPAVKFLWKDRRQEGLQVGSIAQYWKKVLPEAIVEADDGELTMSYGVIALLASIANAREIVNLRREIAELKRKLQIN